MAARAAAGAATIRSSGRPASSSACAPARSSTARSASAPCWGSCAPRISTRPSRSPTTTPFGLTSGIQSLDDREIARWVDRHRGRQRSTSTAPSPGRSWAASPSAAGRPPRSGPGAKAGGPNYVLQLCRARPIASPGDEPAAVPRAAADSYARAWREHFSQAHEPIRLLGERNVFRYRPCRRVLVRGEAAAASASVAASRPARYSGKRQRRHNAAAPMPSGMTTPSCSASAARPGPSSQCPVVARALPAAFWCCVSATSARAMRTSSTPRFWLQRSTACNVRFCVDSFSAANVGSDDSACARRLRWPIHAAPIELRHRTQRAHGLRDVGVVLGFGRLLRMARGGRVRQVAAEPGAARLVAARSLQRKWSCSKKARSARAACAGIERGVEPGHIAPPALSPPTQLASEREARSAATRSPTRRNCSIKHDAQHRRQRPPFTPGRLDDSSGSRRRTHRAAAHRRRGGRAAARPRRCRARAGWHSMRRRRAPASGGSSAPAAPRWLRSSCSSTSAMLSASHCAAGVTLVPGRRRRFEQVHGLAQRLRVAAQAHDDRRTEVATDGARFVRRRQRGAMLDLRRCRQGRASSAGCSGPRDGSSHEVRIDGDAGSALSQCGLRHFSDHRRDRQRGQADQHQRGYEAAREQAVDPAPPSRWHGRSSGTVAAIGVKCCAPTAMRSQQRLGILSSRLRVAEKGVVVSMASSAMK